MPEIGQIPMSGTQQELDRIEEEIERLKEVREKNEKELARNYTKFYQVFKILKKERG